MESERDLLINLDTADVKTSKWSWISLVPRIIALIIFGFTFWWVYIAEGGLGFVESNLFGFHAILMSFAFVLFSTEAFLTFKYPIFVSTPRPVLKGFHVTLHLASLACIVCGLVAIVEYKNLSLPINNNTIVFPFDTLYSTHSWLGVIVLAAWTFQFLIGGIGGYILQQQSAKSSVFRFHRLLGKVVYVLGLATCALGFQNMQSSDLASTPPGYAAHSVMSLLSPVTGLLLAALGATMFGIRELIQ
jgi:hypothetical protein